jgi:hypothetical protein
MSTTEKGDDFRDLVCDLLRTQFPDVETEPRIGGSKVDIAFSKHEFGRHVRFAVECKDYARPLTKSYIEQNIYPKYHALLGAKLVDRVLIVSRRSISTDAAEYAKTWGADHLTYEGLAEALVGMRRYVDGLAQLRPADDSLYVEARLEDTEGAALEAVDRWVSDVAGPPGIAILGGYGQGKTSFARRVASEYAKRHLAEPTGRLPILLRLGEVVHETQLEGLFGKEFTATHRVPGYTFQTLFHLNQQGRLIILLDGFDEMKHAMTGSDFQATFRQFNRLLCPRAKVVLLGRPNALPSDERNLVFRGVSQVGDNTVTSSMFVPWLEWRLAFFSKEETTLLLRAHMDLLVRKYEREGRFRYAPGYSDGRVDEILAKVPADLLRRPVHVALIAEVGADPNFDFAGFNQHKLYTHFVSSMVLRDIRDKPARRPIPIEPRLTFQRDLAWWAWRRIGTAQGCFFRHDVPDSLLTDLPNGGSADAEAKRNEYIVSTLTEEKESGVLFFAHRSFQEFLVAERLRLHQSTPSSHIDYSAFMTSDVVSFLTQAPSFDYILDWYRTLRSCDGPVSPSYLEFFARFANLQPELEIALRETGPASTDPWTVAICAFASFKGPTGATGQPGFSAMLNDLVQFGETDAAAIAALALLAQPVTLEAVKLTRLCASLLGRCLRLSRPSQDKANLTISRRDFDFAAKWVSSSVGRRFPAQRDTSPASLVVDLVELERACLHQLTEERKILSKESFRGNPFALENPTPLPARATVPAQHTYNLIEKPTRERHARYLGSHSPDFHIVQVHEKGHSASKWRGHV